ncbi:MAG TPA: thiamine pyrophosphate-dependent dehydrogenase E1 component subunit alpha [Candidatus Dormibacteraeota bacterium]
MSADGSEDAQVAGNVSRTLPDHEQALLHWYEEMLRIRVFEDKVQELFLRNLVQGTTHLCQGQEAVSVGVAAALRPDDYVTMTYRGHGHALARGMEMDRIFAELMGKRTGVAHGMGGSMHLTDPEKGLIGCFAIVGAGLPVAVGAGMSAKLRESGQVCVTFFGDGATNIGTFHEALNMASVWKAPVIFVIENNLYGEYTPLRKTTPIDDLADRAAPFRMPGVVVDGNDVEAVHEAAEIAVERARRGDGPSLLECKTYRQRGHSRTDPGKYRPDEEVKAWLARDPLRITGDRLKTAGILTEERAQQLREAYEAAVEAAVEKADSEPWPTMDEARAYVYAG